MATSAADTAFNDSGAQHVDLTRGRASTARLRGIGQLSATGSFEVGSLTLHSKRTVADVSLTPATRKEMDERLTRALNVLVAATALLLLSPLLLLVALAVKLTSRGPIFYSQTRVGIDRRWNRAPSHEQLRVNDLGGRPFKIYKFRSMVHNAEHDGQAVWARQGDARVTPIGRFLRASRIDEIPQLWNVLRGDMNVVGPRPERPEIFAKLRETIPQYHVRQRCMPGITGWAQINQAYDQCVDDVRRKVDYDLEYLRGRSAAKDLAIMAKTVPVMVMRNFGW